MNDIILLIIAMASGVAGWWISEWRKRRRLARVLEYLDRHPPLLVNHPVGGQTSSSGDDKRIFAVTSDSNISSRGLEYHRRNLGDRKVSTGPLKDAGPPIWILNLVQCHEKPESITATLTEMEWRLIRFSLERAMESI